MSKKKMVKVTQVKSVIGFPENQRRVMRSLGLRKIGRTVEHEDTPIVRGMIAKVIHLVAVDKA